MANSINRSNRIVYVDDSTALVTKAFAKKASVFGTAEFKLWREYLAEFPQARMHTKSTKRVVKGLDTRNMTYENTPSRTVNSRPRGAEACAIQSALSRS